MIGTWLGLTEKHNLQMPPNLLKFTNLRTVDNRMHLIGVHPNRKVMCIFIIHILI